jgi:hypothetical protein
LIKELKSRIFGGNLSAPGSKSLKGKKQKQIFKSEA